MYADRKAVEFDRQIANIPPADRHLPNRMCLWNGSQWSALIDALNPFEGRNTAGKLVHRDPKLQARKSWLKPVQRSAALPIASPSSPLSFVFVMLGLASAPGEADVPEQELMMLKQHGPRQERNDDEEFATMDRSR